MPDTIATALIAAGGGLIGSAVSLVVDRARLRRERESGYDVDLRVRRLEAYGPLWQVAEPVAAYARVSESNPSRLELASLARDLREWYYRTGGIYFSAESRDAFVDLQEGIALVLGSSREGGRDQPIDDTTFTDIRALGSWRRTTLTYDVG